MRKAPALHRRTVPCSVTKACEGGEGGNGVSTGQARVGGPHCNAVAAEAAAGQVEHLHRAVKRHAGRCKGSIRMRRTINA